VREVSQADRRPGRSQLFTVRLWPCEARGQAWFGRVEHVLTGRTRSFREWKVLLEFLEEVMYSAQVEQEGGG
jgi:hypothetical protein